MFSKQDGTTLKDLSHEVRVERIWFPTLQERQKRVDMIAASTYERNKKKYDRDNLLIWDEKVTRGHCKKVKQVAKKMY